MLNRMPLLFVLAGLLCAGCASVPRYFKDRGSDLADIVTCTVGTGVGAKVRLGPLQLAGFKNRDRAGLRGGRAFSGHAPGRDIHETAIPLPALAYGAASYDDFVLEVASDPRDKSYNAIGVPLLTLANEPYYYTGAEIAIGLGGTLRLGVNPGEALDFVLGWFTLDVFQDDLLRVPGYVRPPSGMRK